MVLDALGSLTAHLLHWIEDPLGFVAGRQGVQDPQVILMVIEDTIVSKVLHNQLMVFHVELIALITEVSSQLHNDVVR